jgi:uncharacterized protein YdeI (YjbR/CyaY-like superfamily)
MSNVRSKPVKEEPKLIVPADLRNALAADASVEAMWNDLTPLAQWDFIHWVDTAKQQETRTRRIERTCDMLLTGKRRPCCYSIVPMNMYRALGAFPAAKKQWGALSPIERRNFITWLDIAKQPSEHKKRTEEICEMLSAGKRQP